MSTTRVIENSKDVVDASSKVLLSAEKGKSTEMSAYQIGSLNSFNVYKFLRSPVYIGSHLVNQSNAKGSNICKYLLSPSSAELGSLHIGHLAKMFTQYTGGFKIHIDVSATAMQSCKLVAFFAANQLTKDFDPTLSNAMCYSHKVVDCKLTSSLVLECPFLKGQTSVLMDEPIGLFCLNVLSPYTTSSAVSAGIGINVAISVQASENLTYFIPKAITLSKSDPQALSAEMRLCEGMFSAVKDSTKSLEYSPSFCRRINSFHVVKGSTLLKYFNGFDERCNLWSALSSPDEYFNPDVLFLHQPAYTSYVEQSSGQTLLAFRFHDRLKVDFIKPGMKLNIMFKRKADNTATVGTYSVLKIAHEDFGPAIHVITHPFDEGIHYSLIGIQELNYVSARKRVMSILMGNAEKFFFVASEVANAKAEIESQRERDDMPKIHLQTKSQFDMYHNSKFGITLFNKMEKKLFTVLTYGTNNPLLRIYPTEYGMFVTYDILDKSTPGPAREWYAIRVVGSMSQLPIYLQVSKDHL